ncbi:MAG: glycosyltransferase [Acidobacteriota bacterium]
MARVKDQRALILHVITSLGRGGAERQLVNLLSNTDRTRFKHKVAFLRDPDDFASEIRSAECECVCLGARGRTQWVYAAKKLRQIIKTEKPAIIQSWLYDANISARLVAPFGSTIPIVVSLQSADYAPETLAAANLPRRKVGVLRVLDSLSARWIDPVFVACSDFVKESATEHLRLRPSRVEVIYNAVDPKTLVASTSEVDNLRMSLGIPARGFVFLNVGRLDPAKGQAILLKSFQKVADRMPNSYLVVLGRGPLKEDLIELTDSLGISDKVLFPGTRADVGAFLSLADVFVFPSFFEGLPLALIEAMSKGLPCIVSEIDTLREVAKHEETALLVEPGSVDQLAEAMLELYANSAKRKVLGDRAQQETNRKFLIDVTIGQWERLYSSLARNSEYEARG